MKDKQDSSDHQPSPWPHRWAVLLVCATFPLIWVGGLVTTYDAGMAVPDWPTTYGYNLFLYPWQTWLYGPWDLFIEHGHRLLGAVVGLITIGLLVVVWRCDDRRWMRGLSMFALALVIAQGVLGGLRVVMDQRDLARIHGCVGPAFFALAVALSVFTSKVWREGSSLWNSEWGLARGGSLQRLACLTALTAYLQLLIGATIRHIPLQASPGVFRTLVFFHLLLAAAVTAQILYLTGSIVLLKQTPSALLLPAVVLSGLIGVQVMLGTATWVTNYGWPEGLPQPAFLAGFTIQSKGWWQSHIATAHVATGSLILATSVQLAVRAVRILKAETLSVSSVFHMKGALA